MNETKEVFYFLSVAVCFFCCFIEAAFALCVCVKGVVSYTPHESVSKNKIYTGTIPASTATTTRTTTNLPPLPLLVLFPIVCRAYIDTHTHKISGPCVSRTQARTPSKKKKLINVMLEHDDAR